VKENMISTAVAAKILEINPANLRLEKFSGTKPKKHYRKGRNIYYEYQDIMALKMERDSAGQTELTDEQRKNKIFNARRYRRDLHQRRVEKRAGEMSAGFLIVEDGGKFIVFYGENEVQVSKTRESADQYIEMQRYKQRPKHVIFG